jgi:transposase InsO family protein
MKPARRRQLVDHTRSTWKVSIRRACFALMTEPSTYHYKSRRTGQASLCNRMKEIAETRVRYGYRRIHVLLRREGWPVNAKRVYRLYREMGLQLRNKTPRRQVKAKLRDDRKPATRSLGLSARFHARLLATRKADRQRVHRVLQWQVPGRVPERTLVHEPRRRAPKMRGLAPRLQ